MSEWLRSILCAAFTVAGLVVFITGVFGVYRFRFVLNRMHAAALIDTMGLLLIVLGLVCKRGFDTVTVKLLLVVGLLWLTSPIASHLIAKMVCITDGRVQEHVTNDLKELEGDGKNGTDGI